MYSHRYISKAIKTIPCETTAQKSRQNTVWIYRPIALLPSLSKIFQRVMFDQLLAYLSNNNLLCINQFGFRPGHSTELAALRLVDHLIAQMDTFDSTNGYV